MYYILNLLLILLLKIIVIILKYFFILKKSIWYTTQHCNTNKLSSNNLKEEICETYRADSIWFPNLPNKLENILLENELKGACQTVPDSRWSMPRKEHHHVGAHASWLSDRFSPFTTSIFLCFHLLVASLR
jgi:hypothetical protein